MGNKLFSLLHAGSVMCNDCNQSANSDTVITSELPAILFLCGVKDREENEAPKVAAETVLQTRKTRWCHNEAPVAKAVKIILRGF